MLALLALVWFATPVLAFTAAIASAPFFGEAPSPEEVRTSKLLLAAAAATGLGAPVVAAFLALRWERRPVAWLALGQLVVTITAVAWLYLASS